MKSDFKVIAITGNARNGKDTVATMLLEEFGELGNRYAFAKKLKQQAMDLLEINSLETLEFYKNENMPYNGVNVRKFLQKLADKVKEADKYFYNDIVINDIIKELDKDEFNYFVITDLRMIDEANRLREQFKDNLVIIKVVKPDAVTIAESNHKSETQVKNIKEDILLLNDGDLSDLKEKVNTIYRDIIE